VQLTPASGNHAGYDGAKKRNGSKVHVAVDTLGQDRALIVSPAGEQDRTKTGKLVAVVNQVTGGSELVVVADQGYTGEETAPAVAAPGTQVQMVKLPQAKHGVVLVPRRWVMERSLVEFDLECLTRSRNCFCVLKENFFSPDLRLLTLGHCCGEMRARSGRKHEEGVRCMMLSAKHERSPDANVFLKALVIHSSPSQGLVLFADLFVFEKLQGIPILAHHLFSDCLNLCGIRNLDDLNFVSHFKSTSLCFFRSDFHDESPVGSGLEF
jgi:hypothetical protein